MTHPKRLRSILMLSVGVGLLLAGGVPAQSEEAKVIATTGVGSSARPDSRFDGIDVDRLTMESDFSVFMRKDCPPDLRQRALQKLWKLMPATTLVEPAAY